MTSFCPSLRGQYLITHETNKKHCCGLADDSMIGWKPSYVLAALFGPILALVALETTGDQVQHVP